MAANAAARFPASVFDIVMKCLVWPVIQSSAGLREAATAITLPAVNIRTWRKFKLVTSGRVQKLFVILYTHIIYKIMKWVALSVFANLQDLRNIEYDFTWNDLNIDKRTLPRWRLLRPGERKICKNNFPFDTDRLQQWISSIFIA